MIDGEGSIHLTRRHKGDYRQLVISISNTEIALLEYVLEAVGAGRITSKEKYQPGHSPSYVYAIENRQALALLTQIEPYLRSYKSLGARLVLDHCIRLMPRDGKYAKSQLDERAESVRSFFLITAHGKQSNRLTGGV